MYYITYSRVNWIISYYDSLVRKGVCNIEPNDMRVIGGVLDNIRRAMNISSASDMSSIWSQQELKTHYRKIREECEYMLMWMKTIAIKYGYSVGDLELIHASRLKGQPRLIITDHAIH